MVDEKTAVHEQGAGARAGGSAFLQNKALLLGTIVVLQTVLALGLTQFVILPRLGLQEAAADGRPGAAGHAVKAGPGELVGLGEIIVTLDSDPRNPRYLRIDVTLEIRGKEAVGHAAARLPQLRDTVIMILSGRSAADLAGAEGKRVLRDDITREVGAQLPEGSLLNVYFSDLVVQ